MVAGFDHERLDVYPVARDFNRQVKGLLDRLPRGSGDLADQLKRAGPSIAHNIAEGAGEWAPKEKARFYRIARRSATECAAALDALVDFGLLRETEVAEAHGTLVRIVKMLVKLLQSLERRRPGTSA